MSEALQTPRSVSLDGVSVTVFEAGCRWIQVFPVSYIIDCMSIAALAADCELSLEWT